MGIVRGGDELENHMVLGNETKEEGRSEPTRDDAINKLGGDEDEITVSFNWGQLDFIEYCIDFFFQKEKESGFSTKEDWKDHLSQIIEAREALERRKLKELIHEWEEEYRNG